MHTLKDTHLQTHTTTDAHTYKHTPITSAHPQTHTLKDTHLYAQNYSRYANSQQCYSSHAPHCTHNTLLTQSPPGQTVFSRAQKNASLISLRSQRKRFGPTPHGTRQRRKYQKFPHRTLLRLLSLYLHPLLARCREHPERGGAGGGDVPRRDGGL